MAIQKGDRYKHGDVIYSVAGISKKHPTYIVLSVTSLIGEFAEYNVTSTISEFRKFCVVNEMEKVA